MELFGYKIFGSPYCKIWASQALSLKMRSWGIFGGRCPLGTDVLVTHGAPNGICDMSYQRESIGAKSLRKRIYELMPKVCCFGHIHEANGCMVDTDSSITFMNSSICDRKYNPVGRAHVIDLDSKI